LLANEDDITYNVNVYNIKDAFIKMLNNDSNSATITASGSGESSTSSASSSNITNTNSKGIDDLECLHTIYSNDVGRKGQREEKKILCAGILNKNSRLIFHKAYDELVRGVVAPHVASIHHTNTLYIQSFPCIRIVRPGEFSIGPHADIAYGFRYYCYY